jgi:Putative beta-barrel porin-2, OmpL-like. bbp2
MMSSITSRLSMSHGNTRRLVSVALAMTPLAAAGVAGPALAQGPTDEQRVDLGTLDHGANGIASGLQLHGFAVADVETNVSSGDSTFSASPIAVSLFQTSDSSRLSFFGQLTFHGPEDEPFVNDGPDEAGGTEAEVDNLFANWVISADHGVDLTAGKFDSPLGLERDDAPLNYQATNSFVFEFARPIKLTGLMIHDAISPKFDGYAILANGWDQDLDVNHGKTAAFYGVWSPSLTRHFGLGAITGNEGEESLGRRALVGTFQLQPSSDWVVGGEFVSGRQDRSAGPEGSDGWGGASAFVHRRFETAAPGGGQWALTVRGGVLDDSDAARTGFGQKIRSVTVSPQYLLGGGFFGPFHYLDRTSLPLPQLALRLDLRLDRSDVEVFDQGADASGKTRKSVTLQLVYVF